MKRLLTVIATLLSFLLLLLTSACQEIDSPSSPEAQNTEPGSKVALMETGALGTEASTRLGDGVYTHSEIEWMPLTDESVFDDNTVILTGIVSNLRKTNLTYEYLGQHVVDPVVLFDFEVSQIIHCKSESYPHTEKITVGLALFSDSHVDGMPVIKEGVSYLLFGQMTADIKAPGEDDFLELSAIADCWVSNPHNLIIERIGDFYLLNTEFLAKAPKTKSVKQVLEPLVEPEFKLSQIQVNYRDPFANVAAKSDLEEYLTTFLPDETLDRDTLVKVLLLIRSRLASGQSFIGKAIEQSYVVDAVSFENYVRSIVSARQ